MTHHAIPQPMTSGKDSTRVKSRNGLLDYGCQSTDRANRT